MKVKDLMKINFSVYKNVSFSHRSNVVTNLYDWLTTFAKAKEQEIQFARHLLNLDKEYYRQYKSHNLYCAAISGIFPNKRGINEECQPTGLICIDIDHISGDIEKLKKDCIENIDSAFLAAKSLSGNGIFVICYYDKTLDFYSVWNALEKDFRDILNINIDPACKDISRLRIISIDENTLIKPMEYDVMPYSKTIKTNSSSIENQTQKRDYSELDFNKTDFSKDDYKELVKCISFLVKHGYGTNMFDYYDPEKYFSSKEYNYAKWRLDAWRLGSLENSYIGKKLFMFISTHGDNFAGISDVENMFQKYDNRCPIVNNVGYYFALKKRIEKSEK